MIFLAIGLLILTAILGSILLVHVLKNKKPPRAVTLLHGTAATFGIFVLISVAVSSPHLWLSVGIFALVAMGGIFLITQDLVKKHIPKMVAVMHGALALGAIAVLLVSVFY